jgi:hypothetical protein
MNNLTNGWTRVVMHALLAAAFFFILNYYLLGTGLESSLSWALALGGIAAGIAYRQMKS